MERINSKICVVLVVDDLGYGGTERQVVEIANNLNRNRFDVHICTFSNNLPLKEQLKIGENKLYIIARKMKYDFTIIPRLAYLLRMLKADIVHGFLYGDFVSRLAGRIAGTSLVLGSERNANKPIGRIAKLSLGLTNQFVNFIIANSYTGAQYNREQFKRSESDYRVVHNGVDPERFTPLDRTTMRLQFGLPLNCPIIGFFGAFRKQKNHSMLFRAFKLVLESIPEARLLIVGDQPIDERRKTNVYKEQITSLVDDLGICNHCYFLGHQDNTEKLYPTCDITVLPSFHEGTPNVLLESMACGIPVIATNVCDNPYIVREGEVGYLVTVGDEEAMAKRIKSLLINAKLRQEMGLKARKWILKEFSTKRMARKMEVVYMELLNGKKVL